MASTSSRKLIDIKETVAKHKNVISNIVSAHALSGCDTVSGLYSIGKSTVVKILKAGKQLKLLGDPDTILKCWSNGHEHIGMVPQAIPNSVSPVPEEIIKMIKSGCSSISRCSSMRCSCSSARLSCSLFCSCHADESCMNKQTIVASQENNENESSESSSFNLYEVRGKH